MGKWKFIEGLFDKPVKEEETEYKGVVEVGDGSVVGCGIKGHIGGGLREVDRINVKYCLQVLYTRLKIDKRLLVMFLKNFQLKNMHKIGINYSLQCPHIKKLFSK